MRLRFSSTLTIYVARQMALHLMMALGGLALLALAVDAVETGPFLARSGVTGWDSVRLTLTKAPLVIYFILPPACLLATLSSLGGLARRGEILAMRTSGVGTASLLAPTLVVALVGALATMSLGELALPPAARALEEASSGQLRRYSRSWGRPEARQALAHLQYPSQTVILWVEGVFDQGRRLWGYHRLEIGAGNGPFRVLSLMEAREATWREGRWEMEGWRRLWPEEGRLEQAEVMAMDLPEGPESFRPNLAPLELGFFELGREASRLEGLGRRALSLVTERAQRACHGLSCMALALLGAAVVAAWRGRPPLGALAGAALAIALPYWLAMAGLRLASLSGAAPPLMAAIAPSLLATLVALALLRRG